MYYLSSENKKNFPFRGRAYITLNRVTAVKPPRFFYSKTFIKKAVPLLGGRKRGQRKEIKTERAFEASNKLKDLNSQNEDEYKLFDYQL